MPEACPECGSALAPDVPGAGSECDHVVTLPAKEWGDWLAPDASVLDLATDQSHPLSWPGYSEARQAARARSGRDASVMAVIGTVAGHQAVLVVWDFQFLGGSVGTAEGELIARAYDTARVASLPIVLITATGGSRMQEGMASLAQMPKTVAAASWHAEAGLLQVAVLTHPTTGGVLASHANVADVLIAEAGATISFAGSRVAEALTGMPYRGAIAEEAFASGLVDAVATRRELPALLERLLAWPGVDAPAAVSSRAETRTESLDAWNEVLRSRDPDRAGAGAFIAGIDVSAELKGDRTELDDPALRVVLARVMGRPVVVAAMTREMIAPAGFRKAWRGINLAERVGVPIVTLIDTPGADPRGIGIAHHISRTMQLLMTVDTPVVACVIGEGGSGGALALATADRVLIQEHATFSVIAPEGAAAILYRDASRAPEVSGLLDPSSSRLASLGIADEVVPEPSGAEVPTAWAAIARHLDELVRAGTSAASRRDRWRGR